MKNINVHIGEVHVAKKGELLTAILGSCVGIGLIWKARKICGLAHSLLPEAFVPGFVMGGRFVTHAVPTLLVKMRISKDDLQDIGAVIAGGGNLTEKKGTMVHVGTMNLAAAERTLKNAGIKIIHIDRGGEDGRKIIINSADCSFKITKIPRIAGAA